MQANFEAKYPGQLPDGLPPSPTIENPGRVYPTYDTSNGLVASAGSGPRRITPEHYIGNPFLMNAALDKLDHALGQVISILEQEDSSQDREVEGNELLRKFRNWRDELESVRLGEEKPSLPQRTITPSTQNEGGNFAD